MRRRAGRGPTGSRRPRPTPASGRVRAPCAAGWRRRGPRGSAPAEAAVCQDSSRHHPHVAHYAHWLLGQGGEVRTAPTVPQRIVIVDRAQALVPIDPKETRKGALHVTEPGIIGALLDLYEQSWNTAVPVGATTPDDPTTGLTPTERELLRLLGTGLTDDTAGQRLGISARTVGRHMASIMERLNAASRFEAGLKAAQQGWL
ncbi:LuxR C-terminal-related transcriptional regulator [Kitasatospora griseola]|uniref:LuxR C-terminal-related transcriptional regulator n=1 Tax=Kitasatospora griseola TaxID=2064 RepID=UPI001670CAC7|nr:LuxR C-terminal-related transcriptional regulator [Kitasatospora griseola]GGR06544.1 hypothetical protein GCM10010195_72050 [Kitasatospora griseola]